MRSQANDPINISTLVHKGEEKSSPHKKETETKTKKASTGKFRIKILKRTGASLNKLFGK